MDLPSGVSMVCAILVGVMVLGWVGASLAQRKPVLPPKPPAKSFDALREMNPVKAFGEAKAEFDAEEQRKGAATARWQQQYKDRK